MINKIFKLQQHVLVLLKMVRKILLMIMQLLLFKTLETLISK